VKYIIYKILKLLYPKLPLKLIKKSKWVEEYPKELKVYKVFLIGEITRMNLKKNGNHI
jgi:hypothetical protein